MKIKIVIIISGWYMCGLGLWATSAVAVLKPKDSITLLYRMENSGIPFYIPEHLLFDSNHKPVDIVKILAAYQISSSAPEIESNEIAWTQAECPKFSDDAIPISRVPALLADARTLLKSFLASDEKIKKIKSEQENCREKEGLNRLFTYAKLRQVINEKKLSHVTLPAKFLVLGQLDYVSAKKAQHAIDTQFRAYAGDFGMGPRIKFLFSREYDPIIFAEEKQNCARRLNLEALKELRMLFDEAPFDVGNPRPNGGNIFSTQDGDAIIIDTEFKDASEYDCFKINLYGPANVEILKNEDEDPLQL